MSRNPNIDIAKNLENYKGEEIELDDKKEDYLKVDQEIQNQKYVCVSFLNPEDVIVKKDLWKYYKFQQYMLNNFSQKIKNIFDKYTEISEGDINHGHISETEDQIKSMINMFHTKYDSWNDMFKNYELKHGKDDDDEYDRNNNFQTSVRGVKIRGSYETIEEARARAAYLNKLDPSFDIYVVPVGYWVVSNIDPNKLSYDQQVYANEELNMLMKGYNENEIKKKLFYEEQTRKRIEEVESENLRKKKDLESLNKKEDVILEDDEWLDENNETIIEKTN